jgi:2,3-dihydroxyphenylpropionate 1,2-dioxygenase
MSFALACASHAPLMFEEELADAATCRAVRESFDRMAAFVKEFSPELIIQFSPDHFHGFHYDNMPSFCVGAGAKSYGDYRTKPGQLKVDEGFALQVLEAIREADIDASVSYDMLVDHGFVQIWEVMFDDFNCYPIVPIFINCIAEPLPFYRRARKLGKTIGRFASSTGKRILFAASGGLSHDPVVPQIKGASAELRARLLGQAVFGPEQQAEREKLVRAAGQAAKLGQGPARPLNPQWDRQFLDELVEPNWDAFDLLTATSVDAVAGAGGNEILCWLAAAAAQSAASGPYKVVQQDYVAVEGWIGGMAHFAAHST